MHTFRTWRGKIDGGSAWLYWMLMFFIAMWKDVLCKKNSSSRRPQVRRMWSVFAKKPFCDLRCTRFTSYVIG
jgi:hypothetical protein